MSTDLKLGLNLGYWQRNADDAGGWLPLFALPEKVEQMYGPSLAAARDGFDEDAPRSRPGLIPAVVSPDAERGWR
ncbi:hypothetical protein [Streptosporangium sp. NPDC087985]|uniref:hypothetical protein n=1 Tax=Streptosporangium sp. NPDC087985 TaxID=3366196 RepID=UPI00381BE2FB